MHDYINWANGKLIDRQTRVVIPPVTSAYIPFDVWKAAGLPVNKHCNPALSFRVGDNAS